MRKRSEWIQRGLIVALLLLWTVNLTAEEAAERSDPDSAEDNDYDVADQILEYLPGRLSGDARVVRDFFGRQLPGRLEQYRLTLDYTPKFGDLVNREYLRFPISLRYALTERTEIIEGFIPYTPNPFRPGEDQRWGPGVFQTGLRHDVPGIGNLVDEIILRLKVEVPIGRPPLDLADYYGRFRPSITLAREVPYTDDWTMLLNFMHDRSFSIPYRNQDKDFLRVNKSEVSPGLLYQPNELGYLLEYTYRALDEETGFRKAHVYAVGLLWDVPPKRVPRLLPGDWQIDLIYRLTDEDERDLRHSLDLRARIRFDFPQFLRTMRADRNGD